MRVVPVAENLSRLVSRQSAAEFEYSRRIIFLVDGATGKNVKTTKKPHLRRLACEQDLKAAAFIRPQQNHRGSKSWKNHEL
jgi:hypothetical protein